MLDKWHFYDILFLRPPEIGGFFIDLLKSVIRRILGFKENSSFKLR